MHSLEAGQLNDTETAFFHSDSFEAGPTALNLSGWYTVLLYCVISLLPLLSSLSLGFLMFHDDVVIKGLLNKHNNCQTLNHPHQCQLDHQILISEALERKNSVLVMGQ